MTWRSLPQIVENCFSAFDLEGQLHPRIEGKEWTHPPQIFISERLMGISTLYWLFDEYHIIVIPGEDVKKHEWDEIKFRIGGGK
jgi:hypothetical protein